MNIYGICRGDIPKAAVPERSCHIIGVTGVRLQLVGTIPIVIVIHIPNCTPEYNENM